MKKYKLVKTYPGSPEWGTVVEEKCKTSNFYMFDSNAVLRSHVENNPEYWEEVYESPLRYMVVTEGSVHDFKVIMTPAYLYEGIEDSTKHIFKTKEEADDFIFKNRPCLSYKDIAGYLSSAQRDVITDIIRKK